MKEVWRARFLLQQSANARDLALFALALDSKLRGCDLIHLKVDDVAVGGWVQQGGRRAGDDPFPNRRNSTKPLTTRQYARLLRLWLNTVGMDGNAYRTHSLRRTKPTLTGRRTGILPAVQLLRGHTKLESTVRTLGVEVDARSRLPSRPTFRRTRRLPAAAG